MFCSTSLQLDDASCTCASQRIEYNKRRWVSVAAAAFLLWAAALVAGCATQQKFSIYFLQYNSAADAPDQVLLAYRYGPVNPTHGVSLQGVAGSLPLRSVNTGGNLPIAEVLYVRWRSSVSGREYEQTVDLRGKLPDNLEGSAIAFVLGEGTVSVYRRLDRFLRSDEPRIGPSGFGPFQGVRVAP
jgi:hypothetical protein